KPRIAQPCQQVLRPRESQDVVPDAALIRVPLHQEALLPCPGVSRQRAVGEAERTDRPLLIDDRNDPASVEPPQAQAAGPDGDGLARAGRGGGRPRPPPAETEVLPAPQGGPRRGEDLLAFSQADPGVVHDVGGWWLWAAAALGRGADGG